MRTNFVLIDSENVKPENIEKLKHPSFRVVVFVGADLKRLDFPIVNAIQALGSNGSYIQISSTGPNALDLHIAYYIGKLAAAYTDASFYIISQDKCFDPLINHLKNQKIHCHRAGSVLGIPLLRSTGKPRSTEKLSPGQRAEIFYEKRIASSKTRPATVASLQSTILSHFNKLLSAKEVAEVLQALIAAGRVVVNGKKVMYPA